MIQWVMRGLLLAVGLLAALLASPQATAEPERVTIGVYINDVQSVDLRSNSYVLDVYLWFRWKDPSINPAATFEFMNTYEPDSHFRTVLYETPKPQPDGSFYQVIRHQGAFSQKFPIQRFPFDRQELLLLIEDADSGIETMTYQPDVAAVTYNPAIQLPGFVLGAARLDIGQSDYPTNFGDLAEDAATIYSRAVVVVPITRPPISGLLKTFVPIWLIMLAALLALFLDPDHVEARIGLAVTSLLALVAMQFTQQGSLPEVSYLTLTDQVYLASYAYIIIVIALVVGGTRKDQIGEVRGTLAQAQRIARSGPVLAIGMTLTYIAVLMGLFFFSLA